MKQNLEENKLNAIRFIILVGILFSMFGAICNILVVGFNDGRMPVKMDEYHNSSTHFSFESNDEIIWSSLADSTRIRQLYFSLGDLFMAVGIILILFGLIMQLRIAIKLRKIKNSLV